MRPFRLTAETRTRATQRQQCLFEAAVQLLHPAQYRVSRSDSFISSETRRVRVLSDEVSLEAETEMFLGISGEIRLVVRCGDKKVFEARFRYRPMLRFRSNARIGFWFKVRHDAPGAWEHALIPAPMETAFSV